MESQLPKVDILSIISEELGLSHDDIQEENLTWLELGVNPILYQSLVAKISRRTGLQLPNDVFENFPDVESFKAHVQAVLGQKTTPRLPEGEPRTEAHNEDESPLSVLIQDVRRPEKGKPRIMFLLPDGSGSAMAYARFRITVADDENQTATKIIALNSPFLHSAAAYTCTIEDLAGIWVQEILRIQPSGPYLLGGWSAGGFYACEVMRHLQRQGQVVEKIILIDSPSRTDFGAIPVDVLGYVVENRLIGSSAKREQSAVPGWLVDHFKATLKAVDRYQPSPLTVSAAKGRLIPEVFIIWATEPLLSPEIARGSGLDFGVRVSRFLLAHRESFGPNGWDKIFPAAEIRIAKMPGNHFSMVHPPYVSACSISLWNYFVSSPATCGGGGGQYLSFLGDYLAYTKP